LYRRIHLDYLAAIHLPDPDRIANQDAIPALSGQVDSSQYVKAPRPLVKQVNRILTSGSAQTLVEQRRRAIGVARSVGEILDAHHMSSATRASSDIRL
jgi:hypothetical protein